MNNQDSTSIISIGVSILSLFVAIGSLVISRRNLRLEIEKWKQQLNIIKKEDRLEFLRDLFNGFTSHNWKFIEYWSFPGVFPPLADMKEAIPDKKEENRELFGQRVVALEHLNVLLRVFTHRDILYPEDIEGFQHWANDWYDDSKAALKTILKSGDTYPLDYICWLRDIIFKQEDFQLLFGKELKARLQLYENSEPNNHQRRKSI